MHSPGPISRFPSLLQPTPTPLNPFYTVIFCGLVVSYPLLKRGVVLGDGLPPRSAIT